MTTNTIFDLLSKYNYDWVRHDGKFGIEIETECESRYDYPRLKYWRSTGDGSLRNFGVEYILLQPLSETELDLALNEFSELKYDFIQNSISTSVHVHRNVLNESPIIIPNVLTLYSILEPMLCKYAGPFRESNLFCLQLKDAEGGLNSILDLVDSLKVAKKFKSSSSERMKYAALNVNSFNRFGSIEFRAMRGVTDTKVIRDWCNIINAMFIYAASKTDPNEVLTDYQENADGLIDRVFGQYAPTLKFKGWEAICDMNLWFGYRIASRVVDWSEFAKTVQVRIPMRILNEEIDKIKIAYGINTLTKSLHSTARIRAVLRHNNDASDQDINNAVFYDDDDTPRTTSGWFVNELPTISNPIPDSSVTDNFTEATQEELDEYHRYIEDPFSVNLTLDSFLRFHRAGEN